MYIPKHHRFFYYMETLKHIRMQINYLFEKRRLFENHFVCKYPKPDREAQVRGWLATPRETASNTRHEAFHTWLRSWDEGHRVPSAMNFKRYTT